MATTCTWHQLLSSLGRLLLRGAAFWLASAAVAATQGGQPGRIRSVDPVASVLLERGLSASPTLRTLVAALEESDVFVYIQTAMPRRVPGVHLLRGETRVAASTPGGRYLCITINLPGVQSELVGTLGHELQHAVEIAAVPEIDDQPGLIRYFREHGIEVSGRVRCTPEAQRAGIKVAAEARRAGTARNPGDRVRFGPVPSPSLTSGRAMSTAAKPRQAPSLTASAMVAAWMAVVSSTDRA